MLITNHVLAGALIGSQSSGPLSALLAGFASHFALDTIPHYRIPEHEGDQIAVIDGLSGLATIGAVLAGAPAGRRLRTAAGIAGACLPDLDKPGRRFFGRSPFPPAFDRLHVGIQTELPQLIGVEVGAGALLAAALVRRYART